MYGEFKEIRQEAAVMEGKMSIINKIFRLVMVIVGSMLIGFGIAVYLCVQQGSDPWTVLFAGISQLFNTYISDYVGFEVSIGRTNQIMGALIVIFVWIGAKRKPNVGTIINFIVVGAAIDLFTPMLLQFPWAAYSMIIKIGIVLLGIVLMGAGIGAYVSADLGEGPIELLMVVLVEKLNIQVQIIKISMDLLASLIGFLLGGPLGWATVASAVGIGPVVQQSMKAMNKYVWKTKPRS